VFIANESAAERAELASRLAAAGLVVVSEPSRADFVITSAGEWARLRPRPSLPSERRRGEGLTEALTPREREVLTLVADGLQNREIAVRLGVSEHTVKFHLGTIFGKLGASTRTEAVRKGLSTGVIDI